MPESAAAAPDLSVPDLAAIREAARRIAPHVHRTPVLTSSSIDREVGARLFFKCENLQKIGAFKARGATSAVFALPEPIAKRGVVTHSSGNHGAAIAYAAGRRGIPAWVVMPNNAPRTKEAQVRRLGATVRLCEPNVAAREAACADVQRESGASLVHPFDDPRVIAGQGTAALELLEEHPDLDVVIAPVGGGGLLSGTSIAASGRVEPVAATLTIADGLRTSLSPRTLAAIRAHVVAIGLASEEAIVTAMRMIWERMKVIAEPSAAVPLACLLEGTVNVPGARVGVILSGGNVDLGALPWRA
jgi:threonine dehydratase